MRSGRRGGGMGGRMDIVIDEETQEERVMYIARFWVPGLSVWERWDWR